MTRVCSSEPRAAHAAAAAAAALAGLSAPWEVLVHVRAALPVAVRACQGRVGAHLSTWPRYD